jgi:hypothetical protein
MLIKDVIPSMIHTIRSKNFSRTGLFKGQSKSTSCFKCPFFETCREEGGLY